ncbi:hypothetical protein EUTSA_v10009667mg, partial [Eutrema salsugineum]
FSGSSSPLSISPFFRSSSFVLMADDEVVDPKKYLEESCKPKCVKPLLSYQACVKRIQGDDSGHKHCTGQYFDYWHCIDKCVSCTQAFCKTEMKRGEAGGYVVLILLLLV